MRPHTQPFYIVNKSVPAASGHVRTALIFTHLHDDSVLLILDRILCTKKELVEDTDMWFMAPCCQNKHKTNWYETFKCSAEINWSAVLTENNWQQFWSSITKKEKEKLKMPAAERSQDSNEME